MKEEEFQQWDSKIDCFTFAKDSGKKANYLKSIAFRSEEIAK